MTGVSDPLSHQILVSLNASGQPTTVTDALQHASQLEYLNDPAELSAGDTNLYAYTFNAPTRFTDPTGRFVIPSVSRGMRRTAPTQGRTSARRT